MLIVLLIGVAVSMMLLLEVLDPGHVDLGVEERLES